MKWKDGSVSWEKLKGLKESNTIDMAYYAAVNRLINESEFKWWEPHVLKKGQKQILADNTKIRDTSIEII